MPKQYEAIRDSLMSKGKSKDDAQSQAAAIYNSRHKSAPMIGHRDGSVSIKRSMMHDHISKSLRKG